MNDITKTRPYYVINSITIYRLMASVLLLFLLTIRQLDIFKWMLAISFFTDAIDGFLARRYKVATVLGARLDSMADDATMVVAVIGLIVFKADFLSQQYLSLMMLLGLYLFQTVLALMKYGKVTCFHTYLAKLAAVLQGAFIILVFFLPQPVMPLFYAAVIVTLFDLAEEIVMIQLLPKWEADVKGLYWVLRRRKA